VQAQPLPELPRIALRERAPSGGRAPRQPEWLLFNDFCVWPTTAEEVTQLYGLQKIPCLLYYTQVWSCSLGFGGFDLELTEEFTQLGAAADTLHRALHKGLVVFF
jgi:hypothetical protein